MNIVKKAVYLAINKVAIASDYYNYYWVFPRKCTAYRGVFSSFSEAWEAIPINFPKGYDLPVIASHSSVANLTASSEIGKFNSRDYPILFWLASAFSDSSNVFDLGGNVGLGFYAYKQYLNYPEVFSWTVCEIPEIVKAGQKIAAKKDSYGLYFTTEFSEAEGKDIFITCGTLQYLNCPLAKMIKQLKSLPRHLLINRVPFYDGTPFFTLQNIKFSFCPYFIHNRTEFINEILDLGYELIDSWKDNRTCSIPFHPECFVNGYHGFYFRLK